MFDYCLRFSLTKKSVFSVTVSVAAFTLELGMFF